MTKPPKRNSKFSSTPAAPAASVSVSEPARTISDNACRIAGTVAGPFAKSGAEPSSCGAPLKRTRCGGGAAPLAMPSALVTVGSMDGTSSGRSSENTTTDGASPFAIPGAARAARHQLRQSRRRLDWRVARHRARRCARPARAVARRCERRHPRGRARRPAAAKNADAFLISPCQRMRCVGIEFDSRREKLRPALSPPSQQPLSKGRGALAFPFRFGMLLRGGACARWRSNRGVCSAVFFYCLAIKSHLRPNLRHFCLNQSHSDHDARATARQWRSLARAVGCRSTCLLLVGRAGRRPRQGRRRVRISLRLLARSCSHVQPARTPCFLRTHLAAA